MTTFEALTHDLYNIFTQHTHCICRERSEVDLRTRLKLRTLYSGGTVGNCLVEYGTSVLCVYTHIILMKIIEKSVGQNLKKDNLKQNRKS